MSGNTLKAMAHDTLLEQVCAWEARHAVRELTPEEKREFLAWLRTSPLHVQAYLEHAQAVHGLSDLLKEDIRGHRRARFAWQGFCGAVAASFVVAAEAVLRFLRDLQNARAGKGRQAVRVGASHR